MDFAQKRRTEGRSASAAVEDIIALLKPIAAQQGVDLQGRLEEAAAQKEVERRELAERLQRAVMPLFKYHRGYPGTLGSCVLVRLDSTCYAFTAAHVLRDAGDAPLWFPPQGKGEKFLRLPQSAGLTLLVDRGGLDIGILMLPASTLSAFEHRVFLTGSEIAETDQPDETGFTSFYYVLGYSGSRTQARVTAKTRQINQRSFQVSTSVVSAAEYSRENLSQSDHILLDYDHNEIVIKRRRVTPPMLQGVSGGGVFHLSRSTQQGPLVAIATENPRRSRLIVGTRIRHFLDAARELRGRL
jgi:hypothetical protein